MRRPIASAALLPLLACVSMAVTVDDAPPVGSKVEASRANEADGLTKAEAGLYRIRLDDESRGAPVLQPEALLRWSNPVVGSIHGSVFAWTSRGCPVAVASIYKWFSPNTHLGVELHALTSTIASAERRGRTSWNPGRAPVDRKAIPKAPRPAETSTGRLRQLRALAGEFTAKETTREGVRRELRLLTQPVYRYQSTDPDVIDGGLFAFVLGTDPEIILAIEARRTKAGPEWQFAAARFNSLTLELDHQGLEAWVAPVISWAEARMHDRPYTLFMFGSDPGMTFDDSSP